MSESRIYLDNNATTRILPVVAETMSEASNQAFGNPGSPHSFGRDARQVLESSREIIADTLNCESDEVIFTSGGTESITAAIHGFSTGRRGAIALTAGEHPATTAACERAVAAGMIRVTMSVDEHGLLRTDDLESLPWSDLKLVAVILAHNETGVIQDLERLSELCEEHRVPLFVDAVQAVGKIPVDFRKLRAAALAFGGHKFHAPRGIGGLLLRRGVRLAPLLEGGHQESGRRAGTEPVPLIAGMGEALRHFQCCSSERIDAVRSMRDELQERLESECAPVIVHGRMAERLPNTLSVAFPGLDGEAMLVNLDLASIACSLGSTCASGSAEPAPALLAMGIPPDVCRSSVRFSVSCQNTREEICLAADRICEIVCRMRSAAV